MMPRVAYWMLVADPGQSKSIKEADPEKVRFRATIGLQVELEPLGMFYIGVDASGGKFSVTDPATGAAIAFGETFDDALDAAELRVKTKGAEGFRKARQEYLDRCQIPTADPSEHLLKPDIGVVATGATKAAEGRNA